MQVNWSSIQATLEKDRKWDLRQSLTVSCQQMYFFKFIIFAFMTKKTLSLQCLTQNPVEELQQPSMTHPSCDVQLSLSDEK